MLNLKRGNHFADAQTMTRGGFIKGILASGISPSVTLSAIANSRLANASVGRGMMRNVVARISTLNSNDQEEEMYKELFFKVLSGTMTDDIVINFNEEIEGFRSYALGGLDSKRIEFRGIEDFSKVSNANWLYPTKNKIEEISLPDSMYFDISTFGQVGSACSKITVKDFIVRSGSFAHLFPQRGLSGCTSLRDFYITSKTAQGIKDMNGFPFAIDSQNANINLVRFHGNDGNRVIHNGTEWVIEADV